LTRSRLRAPVRHLGRIQFVCPVPSGRISFERSDDLWQRVAQRVLRLPAEQLAGTRDVDGIMVVGDIHHPGPDEQIFAENIVLNPGAGFGEGLRYLPRLPRLAVNQAADFGLQIAVAHDLRLPEQQCEF